MKERKQNKTKSYWSCSSLCVGYAGWYMNVWSGVVCCVVFGVWCLGISNMMSDLLGMWCVNDLEDISWEFYSFFFSSSFSSACGFDLIVVVVVVCFALWWLFLFPLVHKCLFYFRSLQELYYNRTIVRGKEWQNQEISYTKINCIF